MRNDPEQNPLAVSYGGKVSVASLKGAIPSQVPYQVCAALFWGSVGIAAALRTRVGLSPLVIALYVAGMSGGLIFWLLLLRRLGPRPITFAIYQPWCWPFFLWLWFGPPRLSAPWWRWLVWGATIPTFVIMVSLSVQGTVSRRAGAAQCRFLAEAAPTARPCSKSPEHCFTGTNSDPNNDSIVLLVTDGPDSVLFTGDAEQPSQTEILRDEASHLHAMVLKVPHHGGNTSLPAFLDAVGARLAVVSVGPNRYGHPVPSVLARLAADGMRVLRTDRAGDVTVVFEDGILSVASTTG